MTSEKKSSNSASAQSEKDILISIHTVIKAVKKIQERERLHLKRDFLAQKQYLAYVERVTKDIINEILKEA